MSSGVAQVALLLVVALLPACGGTSGSGGGRPAAARTSGYAVMVHRDGAAAGRFDVPALRELPAVDVTTPQSAGKQVQHGPLVRTVLARAGIQRFTRLRATGLSDAQTFSAAEIDDQVVLDFDNRGTVKLAGAHLSQDRWVRDLAELDVQS